MSDRVEQDQVTEYIVCGYIRAIYFSVITEISTLCKSYIGYHFNPHRDKFKWTFQCSNLKISNNIDYSSDSDANSDTVFKSPEFKVFDGKFALKLFQNYSIAYIIASFEELPSEWVTFYIQLRIKCIETGFQRTELIRFDEANHITEQYRITNNVEKYKQLTFLIDIINVR